MIYTDCPIFAQYSTKISESFNKKNAFGIFKLFSSQCPHTGLSGLTFTTFRNRHMEIFRKR